MSSSLVHIAIAVVTLFFSAQAQWIHCSPEFGHPTLRNCHDALDAIASVPHPATPFLLGPRHVLPVPDIYLPFSIQVADCLILFNGTAPDMMSWAELITMADFAVSGDPYMPGCVAGHGTGGIAKFASHDPISATITAVSLHPFQIPLEFPIDPHPNLNPNPSPGDQAHCRLQPPGTCDSGNSCTTKAYDNMQQCDSALRSCKSDAGARGVTCVLGTGTGKGGKATQRRRRRVPGR